MAVKYGEFCSARLKPQWESKTKPARDSDGDRLRSDRGARGYGEATDGEAFFQRSADKKADAFMYGSGPGKRRADAVENLTDRFKGSKGINAGEPDHGDDGVR
jgi:hypothetical protein